MFQRLKDNALKALSPTFKWRELFSQTKNQNKNKIDEQYPAVPDNISFEEFKSRYNRVRMSAFIWLVGFVWCAVSLYFSSVWYGWLVSMLTGIICAQFYMRISMELFRARYIAKNWIKRNEPNKMYLNTYIDAIAVSPNEFFPLKLKDIEKENINFSNKI